MDRYDYYEAVKDDIRSAIKEAIDYDSDYLNTHDEHDIYDDLFIDDSVTGNASGSYTFNSWTAEEYVCHNIDLLGEALSEFGDCGDVLIKYGAEGADVTIRCYVLGQVLGDVLEEFEDDEEDEF